MSWTATRVRYVARLNPAPAEWVTSQSDLEPSFLPMEAIGEDASLRLDQTRPINAVLNGYSFFQDGDVAFAKVTPCFENGKAAVMSGLSQGIGFGTTELTVARPNSRIDNRFLFYVLTEDRFRQLGKAAMTGAGGLKRVPDVFTKDYSFPLPSIAGQRQIVDFLDRETAQIDDLIGKQERLIELLAEKRQALITHAVTKGLNPSVPTKPSGVPWLGQVPAHWDVVGSRRIFRERGERARMDDEQLTSSQAYGILSQASFVAMTGNRVTSVIKGEEILKHVEPGDFVISMRSFQGGLELSRVRGKISSAYVMLVPDQSIAVEYFGWLFKCDRYISGLQSTSNLVRDGQALRFANFAQLRLPVPPVQEQRAIDAWVKQKLAAMDKLQKPVLLSLDLLRERRAALISAAVTGKIKVETKDRHDA